MNFYTLASLHFRLGNIEDATETATQRRYRTAWWSNNYQRTGILHFIAYTILGVAGHGFLYTVRFLKL